MVVSLVLNAVVGIALLLEHRAKDRLEDKVRTLATILVNRAKWNDMSDETARWLVNAADGD